jgi:predicted small secreted protein
MKNKKRILGIALIAVIAFTMIACNKGDGSGSSTGGGKTIKDEPELIGYLRNQPANGRDKPIKVTVNDTMPLMAIYHGINISHKYVSLNFSGNNLTTIESSAFANCDYLTSVTIPNSVTSIGERAFWGALTSVTIPNSVTSIGKYAFFSKSLTRVTFERTIASNNLDNDYSDAFPGDLDKKYLAGGIGTYTTTAPVDEDSKWTKQ